MEFKISKKVNLLTITLMTIGVLFTVIGVISGMSDSNFATRFLGNMMVDGFFFLSIGVGALFFLALVYATETGWYVAVKRIIESIFLYIPYGIAIVFIALLAITFLDGAHIYSWMDPSVTNPSSPHYDEIIDGKSAYLNKTFFWIRTLIYFAVFFIYMRGYRRRSLLEDEVGGTEIHYKNFKKSATFLVIFAVIGSTSAWDWIMSIDVHWHSNLFGWYVFAGLWCTALVTIVTLVIYLRSRGFLPNVNDSHVHDIATWTFATSFLWSYMWFCQYMLILMSRDAKRNPNIMVFVGLCIFFGHWMDVYIMITGGSLGGHAIFGWLEIGMLLAVLGLFIRVVLTNLTKAPLMVKHHPYLDESLHHEI